MSLNIDIQKPENQGQRLFLLFRARDMVATGYQQAYGAVADFIEKLEGAAEQGLEYQPLPLPTASANAALDEFKRLRTNIALNFQRSIRIIEFAANELSPDTFPQETEDAPLQSEDASDPKKKSEDLKDDLNAVGAAVAAVAGAIGAAAGANSAVAAGAAAAGVATAGAVVAAVAAGVFVGVAGLELLDYI